MASSSNSPPACGSKTSFNHTQIKINKCLSPPDHWTKVKEVNMENRDPCEVSVTHHTIPITFHALECHADMEVWSQ